MKSSIQDLLSKQDQIRGKLQIWSHLLKKFSMENFIFRAMHRNQNFTYLHRSYLHITYISQRLQIKEMKENICVASFAITFCFLPSSRFIQGIGILNQYSWFWKYFNMADRGDEFSFFRDVHIRFDVKVDISTSMRPMTSDHQIWQADKSRGVDSLATNRPGTIHVITFKPGDFGNLL